MNTEEEFNLKWYDRLLVVILMFLFPAGILHAMLYTQGESFLFGVWWAILLGRAIIFIVYNVIRWAIRGSN